MKESHHRVVLFVKKLLQPRLLVVWFPIGTKGVSERGHHNTSEDTALAPHVPLPPTQIPEQTKRKPHD